MVHHQYVCMICIIIFHADSGGRYAYNKQPSVCRWNLTKLADVLSPCLSDEAAEHALKQYVLLHYISV